MTSTANQPVSNTDSRTRIIEAANRLFYTKGFNQASFADVAKEVGISKGNLHYHFHTKEELLDAIIAMRKQAIAANLAQWKEEFPDPRDRLRRFAQMLLNEEDDVVRYGCPMGSLNMELGKSQQDLRDKTREMFDQFVAWLEQVFSELGYPVRANELALHLLCMAQGATLMSYVYQDVNLLRQEHEKILKWIEEISVA